jgi:hypothetical protein
MVPLTTDSAFPAPERPDQVPGVLPGRRRLTTAVTAGICAVIIGLNGYLIYVTFGAPAG